MEKPKPEKVVKGGWSKWTSEECASGCIAKSKGSYYIYRYIHITTLNITMYVVVQRSRQFVNQ